MKQMIAMLLALSLLLALCACGAPAEPTEPATVPTEAPTEAPTEKREIPTAPAEKNYTVTVIDEYDNPVPGVSIQVSGIIAYTDESGVAAFALEVGEHTVEILEVPFGYALRDAQTELKFEEDVTYLTIYMLVDTGEMDESSLEDDAPVEDIPAEDLAPEG